jgi:hypothetical protein
MHRERKPEIPETENLAETAKEIRQGTWLRQSQAIHTNAVAQ